MVVSHVESLDLKIWHKLGFQMSMIQDGLRDQSFTSLMTDLCQDINKFFCIYQVPLPSSKFSINVPVPAKCKTSIKKSAFNEVNEWNKSQGNPCRQN